MKIFIFFIVMIANSTFVEAGYLAINAKIKSVASTAGGGSSFSVVAYDGTGPCNTSSSQVNIYFPQQMASSADVFKRSYMMIMTAMSSGQRVNIYNYVDNQCDKAVAVELIESN